MKNIARNSLKYTGVVTLSQQIGAKKLKIAQVHNEGGNSLFEFLSDCLIGDFNRVRLTRPTKIMLLTRSTDTDGIAKYESLNGLFFYLLSKPEKYPSESIPEARVRFSFVIPKEIVDSVISSSNLFLGLYSEGEGDPANFAALCRLDLPSYSVANAALLIDWELVIAN